MYQLTRHDGGPILVPDPNYTWEKEGVFNPGVVRVGDEVVMLYRALGETENYISRLGKATSKDGINFTRSSNEPIFGPKEEFDKWGTEDPRITPMGDEFLITYVALAMPVMQNGKFTPNLETATAILRTKDFNSFENIGLISPEGSDNKDIVLFPKKINGKYAMLHRPNHWHRTWCDHLHAEGLPPHWPCAMTELPQNPSIWISWSEDLKNWTDHKVFLQSSHQGDSKIGPGLPPLETTEGWLVIYHHVIFTEKKDSFSYSIRAALFDLNDPTKMIGKLPHHILEPEKPYEEERASSIVFPTGGFIKDDTIYVYYGASDKYVGLATGSLSNLLSELKNSPPTNV
ncbi:glycosidase [Patescibacteria group bacterium]|nr:glycosidase [Patescibacteria group bacterium]